MQLGMNLPVMVPGLGRDGILEWSRRIDQGPFVSLAAGERITFPNPEVLVTLSAAAAITQRVRIFSDVIVLPLHNAVLMAKQLATLDQIAGGRLTVGVGAGAREEDFRAVGAVYETKRLRKLETQVDTMRRMWAGEKVFEEDLRGVEPRPLQSEGPEILAASLSPGSIRRAARWADGICGFSFGPSPAEVETAFDSARNAWQEQGRTTPPRLVTSFWFALGPHPRRQLDEYIERYLNFLGPGVARKLAPTVVTTSAKALHDTARALADLGTDELCLVPTTSDPEEVERVADILG